MIVFLLLFLFLAAYAAWRAVACKIDSDWPVRPPPARRQRNKRGKKEDETGEKDGLERRSGWSGQKEGHISEFTHPSLRQLFF